MHFNFLFFRVLSDSEAEEEDNHQRSPSYMQEQEALKKR